MKLRPAAVAGRFYPADPAVLATLVDALLTAVRPTGWRPAALIAPHAGYRYCGAVAAAAYAQLADRRAEVTRVVVLGPAHFVRLDGMAVPAVDAFATPLGPVPLDTAARRAVLDLPSVSLADHPHAAEHSIETQLPFLLRSLGPGVGLLPVLVGRTPPEDVAVLLSELLTGPDTVAVVSTDLSHYLDQDQARLRDARTVEAILARDPDALSPDDACGFHPLRGLLRHAADQMLHLQLLRHATSADIDADLHRVVGYGSFLLAA